MKEIKLPKVIFGTSALGNLYVALTQQEKCAIVKECVMHSAKPVVFDTAGKYGAGLALESLGRCLQELKVNADEVLISNKLGWYRTSLKGPEPLFEPGVWKDIQYDAVQRIGYDGILQCYEQGNALLNGYHSALVSVHDPDEYLAASRSEKEEQQRWEEIKDAYRALFELKAVGKVKAVGVGAKDWTVIRKITNSIRLDWVMIANSMTLYSHPVELQNYLWELKNSNTLVINSAVFNGGFLTGGDYFNYKIVNGETAEQQNLLSWRQSFFKLCELHNISAAHACVQYGLNVQGVDSIAMSTSRAAKVKGNIDMAATGINESFWTALKEQQLL